MFNKKNFKKPDYKKRIERIQKYYEDLNNDEKKIKTFINQKIMETLAKYDRTQKQIEEMLYKNGKVNKKNEKIVDEIIQRYIDRKLINDERYVENFIRNKFESYKGKTKIINELKKSLYSVDSYTYLLDEYDFNNKLNELIERKYQENSLSKKELDKLQRKLVSDGYDYKIVMDYTNNLEKKIIITEDNKDEFDFEEAIKLIKKQTKKGYGIKKIEQELKYKGIPFNKELFEDYDFFEIANDYIEKKYGNVKKISDQKEKSKIINHMLSRGFSFDEIKESFD